MNRCSISLMKVKQSSVLLNYYVDENLNDDPAFRDVWKKAFKVLSKKDIPVVTRFMADIVMGRRSFKWEYIDQNIHRVHFLYDSYSNAWYFPLEAMTVRHINIY